MTSKLTCGACGLRYRLSGEWRPGAYCVRDGCRGRLGFPLLLGEDLDRLAALWRLRAASFQEQSDESAAKGETHIAAFQRGASKVSGLVSMELERWLATREGPVAALVWPTEEGLCAVLRSRER